MSEKAVPELSIIVPVYKVEKYLPKCIDSILAQTFTDFELILIDDGSPDRCGEICDEYAAKDRRIVAIHQENQGVSAARNAGLDIAKGEYIGFVDSDDWIEPEMYERLFSAMTQSHSDIAFCGMMICDVDGIVLQRKELAFAGKQSREHLLSSLFMKPIPIGGSCCCGLFLKSRISNHRFQIHLQMKEDILFLFDILQDCKSGILLREPYYCVREQQESATRKNLSLALVKTLPANRVLLKRAVSFSRDMGKQASDKLLDDGIRFIRLIKADQSTERIEKRKMAFKVKLFFWQVFLDSVIHRRLTRPQMHGYLFDYFHLLRQE